MKVKCIADTATKEQRDKFFNGEEYRGPLCCNVGDIVIVYGLSMYPGIADKLCYELQYDNSSFVYPVPSCFFEIVDDRPSQYWRMRQFSDSHYVLWPELFLEEGFLEKLNDCDPDPGYVHSKRFFELVDLMEAEFNEPEEPKWYDEYWF